MQKLTQYITDKGEHKDSYNELYKKFHSYDINRLRLVDKFLHSFSEGSVSGEDLEFFQSIEMINVNGMA